MTLTYTKVDTNRKNLFEIRIRYFFDDGRNETKTFELDGGHQTFNEFLLKFRSARKQIEDIRHNYWENVFIQSPYVRIDSTGFDGVENWYALMSIASVYWYDSIGDKFLVGGYNED